LNKTRTRKVPEQRIEDILDATVTLILNEGVIKATMDRVAKQAGVSKGLMYAYFSNRTDLMQQVLKREQNLVAEQQRDAIRSADSFEAMARETYRISENHRQNRGRLIENLKADPEVEAAIREFEQRGRGKVMDYLGRTIANHFELSEDLARAATALLLGFDLEPQPDNPDNEEIWGAMMQGAMLELKKRYGDRHS
jgi:AcrR family transcriptional regulator